MLKVLAGNIRMDARLRGTSTYQSYMEAALKEPCLQPPFFAYFERLLAGVAYMLDPSVTQLSKDPIATWSTVAFQRTSVIVSELVLAFALFK